MVFLGVGDYGVSSEPGEIIKTLGLGSCVAMMGYVPRLKLAGMVHVALPDSAMGADRAKEKPGYFADTGLDALFREMARHGFRERDDKIILKLAGGASVMDPNNTFNIGRRNQEAIKKILAQKGYSVDSEDLGGFISRTVWIEVDSGTVYLSSPNRENWTL